jgi:hypothetical protein
VSVVITIVRVKITIRLESTIYVYESHCAGGNCSLHVEITLVRVKITLVRVLIADLFFNFLGRLLWCCKFVSFLTKLINFSRYGPALLIISRNAFFLQTRLHFFNTLIHEIPKNHKKKSDFFSNSPYFYISVNSRPTTDTYLCSGTSWTT